MRKLFVSGELLFSEGEPCNGLHIIARGKIRIFKTSVNGREQVLAVNGPGETVAELPVALAAVRGHPVTILATLSTQSDHAIVGRTDLGVGSPESLKGKRIGVSAGTSGDFMLDVMLVREGRAALAQACFDFLPTRARLDLDGFEAEDIFAHS